MAFYTETAIDNLEYTSRSLHTLFRRCVQCPSITPSCPACKSDEVCVQISETCNQCASRTCVKASDSGATTVSNGSRGPNVGAISGGVIGAVIFIGITTFILWRFFIKNRRPALDDLDLDEEELEEAEAEEKARRASTSTARRSMASTVLTRASNVIPIAFIPGIVDRTGRGLVPPVPIPTAEGATPYSDQPADHYFMPSDLRDSHYSGFMDDGASSVGRASLTPSLLRGSVASTIYGSAAVVGAARTAGRGKANVVSVHIPAVPQVDYQKYGGQAPEQGQTLPASTFTPMPRMQPGSSAVQRPLSNPLSDAHAISDEETAAEPSFSRSMQSKEDKRLSSGEPNLSTIIEQATRRASRQPTGGLGNAGERGQSPFGDENALTEEDEEAEHDGNPRG